MGYGGRETSQARADRAIPIVAPAGELCRCSMSAMQRRPISPDELLRQSELPVTEHRVLNHFAGRSTGTRVYLHGRLAVLLPVSAHVRGIRGLRYRSTTSDGN